MSRAAVQEDVRGVGISSYNGGHVEFFAEVVELSGKQGAADIGVFGGGGGTITHGDGKLMLRAAWTASSLRARRSQKSSSTSSPASRGRPADGAARGASQDLRISQRLAEGAPAGKSAFARDAPRVIGITGPGGAGKTTLIDELVLRQLQADPRRASRSSRTTPASSARARCWAIAR